MCGRFDQHNPPQRYAEALNAEIRPRGDDPAQRYNVAPSTDVWIVRASASHREMTPLRWGLVPFWADDPKSGHKPINARAETATSKAGFRKLIGWRRCVVPVDGFFEWKALPGGKVPYYIRLAEDQPMFLAGLWDRWQRGDSPAIESFTLITTAPNELTEQFHDRMPAIIAEADLDRWLDPQVEDPADVAPLLRPYPAEEMIAYPVSRRVNAVANDGPDLIEKDTPTESSARGFEF